MSINTEYVRDKLIFSTYGDSNHYPYDAFYAYLGAVGSVGGQPTAADGQTVHIHKEWDPETDKQIKINLGTVVHLVLHSLG